MFDFMVEYTTRKRGIMNTFKKEIRNNDKTVDIVFAKSNDKYDVMINDNYKLIKFSNNKKSFTDSILGTDIGVNSKGFISVISISLIIAVTLMGIIVNSCRL